ncbi:hypothetical protein [Streptomyces cellostaticus]|uniref:hypothetical protein n=1 Tax=Streptomyces cellostaticus TaxID=67285 RepID=UPI0020272609|nr:hypothetical protein [Streptomyces cellostaticus]
MIHVDSEVLDKVVTAAGAVALVFIGGWENGRRTRKAEERKDAAADRAALEAQANELVKAVLELKVAGNMHDQLFAGQGAKARLFVSALSRGASAALGGRGGATSGLPALFREMWRAVDRWEQDTAASAARLETPLSRLGTAAAPLMRHREPGLAAGADAVFKAATEEPGNDDRMAQALESFHAALSPVLNPPAPSVPRWVLWRRRRAE